MTIAADPSSVSEAARERETFKYGTLKISTASLLNADARPIPSAVLSSTPDPGLTAFAQLGLYRLHGSRALVSLFDRNNQHIVAEALRASPLNLKEEQLEQPCLCGTAVPRATSICEHVLAGPAVTMSFPGRPTGSAPSDLPVSVVPDLNDDARFCSIQDKHKRFYIGVPIRSPAGINIGVYCVFDDQPRQGVSAVDIQFIRDISRTIMDYLEAKRSHECYRREERMVRGLGSFVEGKATLSNWSQSSNPSSFQDIPGVQEGNLNKKLQQRDSSAPNANVPATSAQYNENKVDNLGTEVLGASPTSDPSPKANSAGDRKSPSRYANTLREDVQGVFSKAANIIREAIEVEGVLYLDASVRTFGGLVGREVVSPSVVGESSSDASESSCDEIPSFSSGDLSQSICCTVLGFSTSESSSVSGDAPESSLLSLPERLLHWLLGRYPHGKLFNIENGGDVRTDSTQSPSVSPLRETGHGWPNDRRARSIEGKSKSPEQRHSVIAFLAHMFPSASSAAFVPLWDPHRNRWFAGGFVWTRTPTRIFVPENELSYLKVYGLTLMAEVTRLHIKAADRTKMDVLGSISHELRSPLHGVVGAAEILRQTTLDGNQRRILHTIEISSRTLLDTIDHLLDYGKINGLVHSGKREINNTLTQSHSDKDSVSDITILRSTAAPLDRLTEEVVESVLAGYDYLNMPGANSPKWNSTMSNYQSCQSEAVQIVLSIEPSDSWSFQVHPGAFRRVVMNLFGNSLKFTKTGFISIHLKQEAPGAVGLGKVHLTVSDSGKGISEEYLRDHLYTPFAQEDHFAPGTGLGLSLVRQVVSTLGGEMQVASRLGYGTTVTVTLPLLRDDLTDEEKVRCGQELVGSRVLLRGFEKAPSEKDAAGNDVPDKNGALSLQLIESMCQGWLHMDILSEAESKSRPPDFVICSAEFHSVVHIPGTWDRYDCPHILIRRNSFAGNEIETVSMPMIYETTSQPLGPRKLVRCLLDSRRRWIESRCSVPGPINTETTTTAEMPLSLGGPPPECDVPVPLEAPVLMDETKFELQTAAPTPQGGSSGAVSKLKQPTAIAGTVARQHIDMTPTNIKPATASAGHDRSSAKSLVLIVDDNPINCRILVAHMKRLRQEYATATNGLEALEKYRESASEYSCILTDISMPVMDGLESARRIREFERANQLKACKIIALTGLSGSDVQEDAFASGVDLFFTRPVAMKDLFSALQVTGRPLASQSLD